MKFVDIADETYQDLGEPTDVSIPVIAYWLRTHIGKLNTVLATSYSISNFEIDPVISAASKDVYKRMYMVHYYEIKIRETLQSAAVDSVIEVTSDGATVRKLNKNELSKTWLQLKRDTETELKNLTAAHRGNASTAQGIFCEE